MRPLSDDTVSFLASAGNSEIPHPALDVLSMIALGMKETVPIDLMASEHTSALMRFQQFFFHVPKDHILLLLFAGIINVLMRFYYVTETHRRCN